MRRVLCIIDAGRMRSEAQNAFLKSLEEPPLDTCVILTASTNGNLLETIVSRVQRIDILPVSADMAKLHYDRQGIPAVLLARSYALSQGQAGLLHSLLQTDIEHPLKEWVETAKQLLSISPGERILRTDELSKDKPGVLLLINALGRIVNATLRSASLTGNAAAVKRWQSSLQAIQDAREGLNHNANIKLLLDHLLLNI